MFKLTHDTQEINAFLKSVEHLKIIESDEDKFLMHVENKAQFNALKECGMGDFHILYKNKNDDAWRNTNKTVKNPEDFYKYVADILEQHHNAFIYDDEDCSMLAAEKQDEYADAVEDGFIGDFNAWCKKNSDDPKYATIPGVWHNGKLILAENEFQSYFDCKIDGDSRDCEYWLAYSFDVEEEEEEEEEEEDGN